MIKNNNTKQFGFIGEQLVIHELIARGFIIVVQNYTAFTGEIDIIARKKELMAFIEVKSRHNPLFDMTELISYQKQRKIIATAKRYCAEHKIIDMICRFDVALVSEKINEKPTILIIENAFTESSL